MLVFLVGFMGVGKTTIGKRLASALHYKFLDTDHVIENELQRSVETIFEEQGEDFFRNTEHTTLSSIIKENSEAVISTGGGLPCFLNNMDLMKASGVVIYLKAPAEMLVNRLVNAKTVRPLIAGKSRPQLGEFINQVLQKREPIYQQANITVEAANITSETIRNICTIIQQHPNSSKGSQP